MKVHLISKLLFDQQLTHTHTHMIRITDSNYHQQISFEQTNQILTQKKID